MPITDFDASVSDHGTVALLTPHSPAARQWVEENLQIESWQRMGPSIACHPRLLTDVLEAMHAEGFTLTDD